jgi:hypothetical protein
MELLDDIHASADLPVVKPKHEMTVREHHPRQAPAMVRDELMLDGNPRRNLAPPMKPFPTHWDCWPYGSQMVQKSGTDLLA